ncbi:flagellin [Desulfohalobium retbaense]|uniref:Flagellin n=1 Tax=Desulfohalobium retbaense (strain ATCC 49708 / DSM 5692 / JCM 16813 / HR100) TaxID=485915 RepID=C8WZ08_DESRD|nr:flagellin [Desulfohalobium retbaense]ACV67924.1 flagellin domain protein [Desulfohalobium retbaense DSM 5692]
MALSINTNMASLQSQMSLANSTQALEQNQQRLATGLRINSAADDAAGLTITDGMTSQIRGMNQAVRNANDGISMAQTAEGGAKEITNMLQRMRELAVQAANDTNTNADKKALQQEFDELASEISRVGEATQFNTKNLLTGTEGSSVAIQVGPNNTGNDTINIDLSENLRASAAGLAVDSLTIGSGSTLSDIQAAISGIDTAIGTVDEFRSELGATQNRLQSSISNLENAAQNLTESRSRIMDADIAKESAEMTQNNVRQQASAAVLAQANQQPQLALQLLG